MYLVSINNVLDFEETRVNKLFKSKKQAINCFINECSKVKKDWVIYFNKNNMLFMEFGGNSCFSSKKYNDQKIKYELVSKEQEERTQFNCMITFERIELE